MDKADLILTNGKVLSVTLEGDEIHAEAVAVKDGKILEVGSNSEIMAFKGKDTEVVDCEGNTILPGMCDAHCHPAIGAAGAKAVDLFGVYVEEGQTIEDAVKILTNRVKEYVEANPEAEVIRGQGWVYQIFTAADRLPNRHDLDKICSDKPVILESFCQHNLWVNTKAIECAGLDENTPDVKTGKIYREENGYPSGLFNDPEAMEYIKSNVSGYELSVDEYKEAILWYQQECANKHGVTFVQDCMHSENASEAYRQLAEEGKLTIRMRGVNMLKPESYQEDMQNFIERKGKDNVGQDYRIDTVKMFAEGGFVFIDGYRPEYCAQLDLPEDYNEPLYWSDEVFVSYAAKAMEAGFNVHVHAMGDKAVKQAAECLAEAQHITGMRPRNIIAHLMITPDETAQLMGREEIIANCQPAWMVLEDDVMAVADMVGFDLAKQSYPYRKFVDNGVRVACGTDFPVTPPSTMVEICSAMTRSVYGGYFSYEKYKDQRLGDEEPIDLISIIQTLSINGAFQMFGEEYTGSIEKGKSAELVVLDSDIENTRPEDIYLIKIAKTYFKGKQVYSA